MNTSQEFDNIANDEQNDYIMVDDYEDTDSDESICGVCRKLLEQTPPKSYSPGSICKHNMHDECVAEHWVKGFTCAYANCGKFYQAPRISTTGEPLLFTGTEPPTPATVPTTYNDDTSDDKMKSTKQQPARTYRPPTKVRPKTKRSSNTVKPLASTSLSPEELKQFATQWNMKGFPTIATKAVIKKPPSDRIRCIHMFKGDQRCNNKKTPVSDDYCLIHYKKFTSIPFKHLDKQAKDDDQIAKSLVSSSMTRLIRAGDRIRETKKDVLPGANVIRDTYIKTVALRNENFALLKTFAKEAEMFAREFTEQEDNDHEEEDDSENGDTDYQP